MMQPVSDSRFIPIRSIVQHVASTFCLMLQTSCLFILIISRTGAAPTDASTFPSIEEDIQALVQYSAEAQSAGQRLVEQGFDAISELHATLDTPSIPFEQKMQLIAVLGEMGYPESANLIIQTAKASSDNRYLYQVALLSLAKFKPTDTITSFVNQQLADTNRDALIQRSALTYYAQQPHPDANQWVEKYAATEASPNVRYAALYLGGKLGMETVKDDIVTLLQQQQKTIREYYLLVGLAEITTLDEFRQITDGIQLDKNNLEKIKQYAMFLKGTKEQRNELASVFIEKGDATQKNAAIKYLTQQKNAEVLAKHWQDAGGIVKNTVRRAGYEIEMTNEGAQIVPFVRATMPRIFWYVILGLIFIISLVFYKYRRNRSNSHDKST